MRDVGELGQHGMSRLPWKPWDTSCTPSNRLAGSQWNIWMGDGASAGMGGTIISANQRREWRSTLYITHHGVKNHQICAFNLQQVGGKGGKPVSM